MNQNEDARNEIVLTRGTKKLIAEAIKSTGSLNNHVLCNSICQSLCDRFSGESLDYQLNRMNIASTKSIMDAIDVYIYQNASKNGLNVQNKGA